MADNMTDKTSAGSSTERTHYRLEKADSSGECNNCGQPCEMWTVVFDSDGEPCEIGTSWGHKETAQDVCDLMNMAFDAGQESRQETITGLCDRLDRINNLTRPRPARDPYAMLRDIEEWSSGFMKVPT